MHLQSFKLNSESVDSDHDVQFPSTNLPSARAIFISSITKAIIVICVSGLDAASIIDPAA